MSSRFANAFLTFSGEGSSFCTDFGTFGVGILPVIDPVSFRTDANNLWSLFFRSCFCLARTFRLWSLFRVVRRSA